jgi:uncharacterized protein with PIN domain
MKITNDFTCPNCEGKIHFEDHEIILPEVKWKGYKISAPYWKCFNCGSVLKDREPMNILIN